MGKFDRPGVYLVHCGPMLYVGASVNMAKRWRLHKSRLKFGTHKNPRMQALYDARELFNFRPLEYVSDSSSLRKREKMWIEYFRAGGKLLNRADHHREESNAKNAEAHLGKVTSEITKIKLSVALKKATSSAEVRSKMSERMLGNQNGKGHVHSEEHKRKISEGAKAKWAEIKRERQKSDIS